MAPTFLWHKASSLTFKSIRGVFVISLLGFITGCLGDKTDCSETPVTDETTSITATQPVDYIATFETEPPTLVRVMRQDSDWVVCNGTERIQLRHQGDEVYLVPVFHGSWVGEWSQDKWIGVWVDSLRPHTYSVPLSISPLPNPPSKSECEEVVSRWSTTEGVLHMSVCNDSVQATITTPTGDYRFLSGTIIDNNLEISTFDGSHLFRFDGKIDGDSLVKGSFISGTHYKTDFSGVQISNSDVAWGSSVQQPLAKPLTFHGISQDGTTNHWSVSQLQDQGSAGLVLDIIGTWCPNCMDESRLLREIAPEYPEIQFISLAFERSSGEQALHRIAQFQSSMELPWPVWLGGEASKAEAARNISVLDAVYSFPTTIFWPLDGEPTIHQGFNGPATGVGYEVEKTFFRSELNRITGRSENR